MRVEAGVGAAARAMGNWTAVIAGPHARRPRVTRGRERARLPPVVMVGGLIMRPSYVRGAAPPIPSGSRASRHLTGSGRDLSRVLHGVPPARAAPKGRGNHRRPLSPHRRPHGAGRHPTKAKVIEAMRIAAMLAIGAA